MPKNAPKVKVSGVRSHGAEVILCEPNLEARVSTANSVLERTGAAFIHPNDNPNVIAGQGTAAKEMIEAIVADPDIGRIYEGPVKNTTTFGAFIEIMPGTEGLCHISELQESRTERTEDVLKKGDITKVKLLSIDEKGRLRLSRKAALAEEEAAS